MHICFYTAAEVELLGNQPIIALLMILTLLHSFKESHLYCIRYKKSSFIDMVYDFIKPKDFILITTSSSAIFPQCRKCVYWCRSKAICKHKVLKGSTILKSFNWKLNKLLCDILMLQYGALR